MTNFSVLIVLNCKISVWDRPYAIGFDSNGIEVFQLNASGLFTHVLTLPDIEIQHLIRSKMGLLFGANATQLCCIMKPSFYCYNCGEPNSHISKHCPMDQEFTRCPQCDVVARSAAGHKINCINTKFVSAKIGEYELPLMPFHCFRFMFKNISQIYCAELTASGLQNFMITKFFSVGTNIRVERVYGSDDIIMDVRFKPSFSMSFGRCNSTGIIASILFCEDQIRINHYQHIDKQGKVTYSLSAHPKTDTSHDIDIKLLSEHKVVFCSLLWNDIKANIAMSESGVSIQ